MTLVTWLFEGLDELDKTSIYSRRDALEFITTLRRIFIRYLYFSIMNLEGHLISIILLVNLWLRCIVKCSKTKWLNTANKTYRWKESPEYSHWFTLFWPWDFLGILCYLKQEEKIHIKEKYKNTYKRVKFHKNVLTLSINSTWAMPFDLKMKPRCLGRNVVAFRWFLL